MGHTCGCGADDLKVGDAEVPAERLVIGLNPPFGKNDSLANEFVAYAAEKFLPRLLVLVVPPVTKVATAYKHTLKAANLPFAKLIFAKCPSIQTPHVMHVVHPPHHPKTPPYPPLPWPRLLASGCNPS
jgi:hypothetical protein